MQIELYSPTPKQLDMHRAIEDPMVMYLISAVGRQFGKTLFGENQAIKWCLDNAGWNVAWISPTYKQCKKVFREIKKNMGNCPAFSRQPNESDLIFYFGNGSQLIFYSAEAYDSIRGESFDAVICDEFRFFHRLAWSEGIKPTLTVKGKKCLIMSTPKGKGDFYTLFQYGKNDSRYRVFSGSSYDNPYANREEIEDARRNLPDHIFRQEYLAEFLQDGSEVFNNIKESIRLVETGTKYFAGVDLGRADDWTVLTIVNEKNEEVFADRWRHMPWSNIIDKVVEPLNKFKPFTKVEANGAQDAIYEMIRNKVSFPKSKVEPFVTTSQNKQIIVEDLIVGFEKKDLAIIGYDWQVGELESFAYTYNPKTRSIKYSAPLGLHDDYVMSRAITNNCRKDHLNSGRYIIV
ncbi:MAG: terminase large subunit domain-containing protein [Bacteroidia bacterium]